MQTPAAAYLALCSDLSLSLLRGFGETANLKEYPEGIQVNMTATNIPSRRILSRRLDRQSQIQLEIALRLTPILPSLRLCLSANRKRTRGVTVGLVAFGIGRECPAVCREQFGPPSSR